METPVERAEGAVTEGAGFPRPIVVVSECLGFAAVRYNGQILRSRFVDALRHVSPTGPPRGKGIGLFARAAGERVPLAAIEDEGRLTNLRIRHHFLETFFTVARFRAVRAEGKIRALVLRTPAGPGPVVNVLQHAFGYLSDELSARERAFFLELLEVYRAERALLASVLAVLRAWIVRYGQPYLEEQRLFSPYPRALLELTDSSLRSRI